MFWIFGYGSLIWKVDFKYCKKQKGYIKGYERKFYQHSIDHRGTVENPGRVVTLVPSLNKESRVWGIAYAIADEDAEQVLLHLDHREKNGYTRLLLRFYVTEDKNVTGNNNTTEDHCICDDVIVYIASEHNASFAGPINMDLLAKQVFNAEGPSGKNREYVYKLANAMQKLFPGVTDSHLIDLELRLKSLERS